MIMDILKRSVCPVRWWKQKLQCVLAKVRSDDAEIQITTIIDY